MRLVNHVVLTCTPILKLLRTEQAESTNMNSLSHVPQQSLKVNEAINVQNGKTVSMTHMVKVFLDSIVLLVTEQATSECFDRCLPWHFLLGTFWDRNLIRNLSTAL